MKILFADDHVLILEGLKDLLKKKFPLYEVLLAENKVELFEKLQKNKIDLLIQDIKFGRDHASSFINDIISENPQLKILILSSISDASTIQNLSKKTNGYILKTEPTHVIYDGIEKVLNGEHYISPQAEKINANLFQNDSKFILTKRELDIIREIMKEFPTKRIAENLQISNKTVEMHRANIYLKLDVSNVTGLVKKVIGLGLIDS